jgi:hypothetical protein
MKDFVNGIDPLLPHRSLFRWPYHACKTQNYLRIVQRYLRMIQKSVIFAKSRGQSLLTLLLRVAYGRAAQLLVDVTPDGRFA